MKRGQTSPGFTIVETMIFLVVSSALITSAFTLVGGAQNKTEFTNAVNEIEQQINDVANNVATGYYASTETSSCTLSGPGGSPVVSPGGGGRGTNNLCTYIGRIIYFSDGSDYQTHNVAGVRERTLVSGEKVPVTSMADAKPAAFGQQNLTLRGGLRASRMISERAGIDTQISAIGFFTTLGNQVSATSSSLESNSQQYEIIGIPNSGALSSLDTANLQTQVRNLTSTYAGNRNPDGGIKICFDSGTTNQRAIITVGGTLRGARTNRNIETGNCGGASL